MIPLSMFRSGDYMQGTHLKVRPFPRRPLNPPPLLTSHNLVQFNSKEDAVAFAEKQGWEYYCQEPQVQMFVPKSYAKCVRVLSPACPSHCARADKSSGSVLRSNYGYTAKKLRIHHTSASASCFSRSFTRLLTRSLSLSQSDWSVEHASLSPLHLLSQADS